MANLLIIGASKGLGRAFAEGLGNPGDSIIGVSRQRPATLPDREGIAVRWIEADFSEPRTAITTVLAALDGCALDTIIYNLGVWEQKAFEENYSFLEDTDDEITRLVSVNVTATILFLRAILPTLLKAECPRLILTGSTSALRNPGRPEVTFGATKAALNGIADALRVGFRQQKLAVTTLQLGYLNTEDDLSVDRKVATERGDGTLIPLHDVVAIVHSMLSLSGASFIREIVMPAIRDERF